MRGKPEVLRGYFDARETAAVRAEAERRGMTVSELIRIAALAAVPGRSGVPMDPVLAEVRFGNALFMRTMEATLEGQMKTGKQFRDLVEALRRW
jgi:antitoxin component of RelBE/YafQ-DinJ toxin-antitoxin module